MTRGALMKAYFFGILLMIILLAPITRADPPFYLGGIQVNEPDQSEWVSGLKTSGMNTVSITVYGWQGPWDSDIINFFDDGDETKVEEIRAAKSTGLSVILIIRVALQHAHPENRFLWHGMIMPETERELETWFGRYADFVLKWASIAEREGVDVFVIGSEMNALTATKPVTTLPGYFSYFENTPLLEEENEVIKSLAQGIDRKYLSGRDVGEYPCLSDYLAARKKAMSDWSQKVSYADTPDRLERINKRRSLLKSLWIGLIDRVGERYEGHISYAANYDSYQEVDFWDRLDFIGINAYFPLRNTLGVNRLSPGFDTELEKRWGEILSDIESFRTDNHIADKRVIFTELGYTFRRHSTVYPWGSRGFILVGGEKERDLLIWDEEPLDFEERALAIRALYKAYKKKGSDFLAGMLYWKFSTDKSHFEVEPFLVYLGSDGSDPLLYELRRFLN